MIAKRGGTIIGTLNPIDIHQPFVPINNIAKTKNAPLEARSDQFWEVAGMIEMHVGENDGVERGGVERQLVPVAFTHLLVALEQSAVNQHVVTA